jgi:glutaredoxin-like YruB-family protein
MIKIYTTPTCPYCKLAKEFLREKNVSFDEINVAEDTEAAKEMVRISGQMGVPVLEIDGKIIVGWNRNAIEELLQKQAA